MRTIIVALTLVTLATAFRISSLHKEFQEPSYGRHSERSVDSSCPTVNYVCVPQGGNCTFDYTSSNYPICVEGQCADNVCPTLPGLGAACSSDDCSTGLTCHPATRVCVIEIQVKPPGASCTTDNQCLYSVFGASDVRSSCVSGSCYGIALGGTCTGSNQCVGRAYCSSGTCTALQTIGQPCTSSAGTVAAATCNEGTVTQLYSLSAGSTCSSSAVCGVGYYCNSTFAQSGLCLSANGGGNVCESSADCANGGYCACYGGTANSTCPVPDGTTSAESSVALGITQCIDAQQCAENDFSCITSKCKSQYCAYRNYAISQNNLGPCSQSLQTALTQYVFPPIDCSSNNSAVQQVASFALVVSMILAVVLL